MSKPCAFMRKADLRAAALAKRDALSGEQRAAAAQAIAQRGLPIEITRATIVSGYSPIRSEIDPVPLMRNARRAGRATGAAGDRGARSVADVSRLVAGRPADAGCRSAFSSRRRPRPNVVPDIMLVPLAAFDRPGHRIGYGAGHYDRTLAQSAHNESHHRRSALPSRCRKSRRFPRCRTTWRWIMC